MRANDEDVLEELGELVRRQRGALVAVARSEGLSAEEALESVQDALCTFVSRARESRPAPEHALASIKTITRNAARNARRRHHRRPHDSIDDVAGAAASAEELVARTQDVVRLRVCMASLCTSQRAAVTLRLLDERSGEDVARELGLTRAHVDVLVHRAKLALRACMLADASAAG